MPSAISVVRKFFPEVKFIEDAGRNAMIEVTKADEASAKRKSHKTCAMAVACKRKFSLDGVVISVNTAYLVKGDTAKRYVLPQSVSREVVSFDRDGGFAPGEYQLSKVPEARKLGKHDTGNGHGPNGHVKERVFRHHTEGIRTSLGSKTAAE
ncbi:MAG: hypothetical protein OK436_05190 [Thaumarchaeota archaeon]|nr:hypothetical protein [Nitrososphaerota archaeon]